MKLELGFTPERLPMMNDRKIDLNCVKSLCPACGKPMFGHDLLSMVVYICKDNPTDSYTEIIHEVCRRKHYEDVADPEIENGLFFVYVD